MKRFLQFILVVLLFSGCDKSKTENEPAGGGGSVTPTISLSQNSVTVPAEGSTVQVTVNSSASWTLSGDISWCKPSVTSGKNGETVSFTVAENAASEDRNATYSFVCGSASARLTITQKAQDALTVTNSRFEIESAGGQIDIEVKSSAEVSYVIGSECRDWIKFVTTRAISSSTLIFEVEPNTDIARREGSITIKSGSKEEVVRIYQAGEKATILLSQSEYEVGAEGDTITVEVSSNVDVDVEIPSVGWITRNDTRAMSTHTFHFDISENRSESTRTAAIAFVNSANGIKEYVTVIQGSASSASLKVSATSVSFDASGGRENIDVISNVDWEVSCDASWCRLSAQSGNGNGSFTISASENSELTARAAIVTVRSVNGDLTQRITVIQGSADEIFELSTHNISLSAGGGEFDIVVSSNIGYYISDKPDWISEISSTSSRAYTETVHRFSAGRHSGSSKREGVIVFCNDNQVCIPVVVTQTASNSSISVSHNTLPFSAVGGSERLYVTSNTSWVMSSDAAWCDVSPAEGSGSGWINFAISENVDVATRKAVVTITAVDGGATATVIVSQEAAAESFSVTPMNVRVSGAGGEFDVTVATNVGYYLSKIPDWIKETTPKQTRATQESTHRFVAEPNMTSGVRSDVIIFSKYDERVNVPVTVTQEAGETVLTVSKTTLNFGQMAASEDVYITSNIDWRLVCNAGWCWVTPEKGSGSGKVSVIVDDNESPGNRTAIISLQSADGTINRSINVTQQGKSGFLSVSRTAVDIAAAGGEFTFTVEGNIPARIGVSHPSIISLSRTDYTPGLVTSYTCRVLSNDSSSDREMQVRVYNDELGISKTIVVRQAGSTPGLDSGGDIEDIPNHDWN